MWLTRSGKRRPASLIPLFHSAMALDYAASKKDYANAIKEYTQELMLYPAEETEKPGPALADTLQLAQAYTKPGDSQDLVKAVWFYARVFDFAPPAYQKQIAPQLEYWYKRYHGSLKGLEAVKTAAQGHGVPAGDFQDCYCSDTGRCGAQGCGDDA